MDSNLPQSKSSPSNLVTGRRHRVSISVSGSYQSHLSGLGSLHRVRTNSEQIPLGPVVSDKDYLHILEGGLAEQRPRVGRLCLLKQLATDPTTFLSDDLRRIHSGYGWRSRVLFTLYCCFCVAFLTVRIHTFCQEVLQLARPGHHQSWGPVVETVEADVHGRSFINVTLSQCLSIAFRGLPPRAHLDKFVLHAHPGQASDLTACLWVEDARVEEMLTSAQAWPGPVSLVIVTTHAPHSTGHTHLLDGLSTMVKTKGPHAPTNACVHVLYVPSVAGSSSNVYLNMARFFAPTSRVVLFPDGIPKSALSGHAARWLGQVPVDASHPIFLTNATQRTFSPRLPLLAPVVLPRDYPVWCTERLYMFGSRALDWDDCLWNLWLESDGEASSIVVPHLWDDRFKNTTVLSVPPHAMKIRHRWSTKYRSEACAFTLKRSQALESLTKTGKRHMQWRKKFCREAVGPSGALDVP